MHHDNLWTNIHLMIVDERTGKTPQRHISGRFISLIPREYPASTVRKGKRTKDRENQKSKEREVPKNDEVRQPMPMAKQPPVHESQRQIEQQKPQLPMDEHDLGSFDLDFDFNDDFGGQRGVSQFSRM
jgi:hypothetical protein